MNTFMLLIVGIVSITEAQTTVSSVENWCEDNLIPNGDFAKGEIGELPTGWEFKTARPSLAPFFRLTEKDGQRFLMATGNGQPDCVGYVRTEVPITLGKTYYFRARFKKSEGLNPQRHLLFQCFGPGANNGIFDFRRLDDGCIEGDAKIHYPGEGNSQAEVRLLFRLSANETVWLKNVSLVETTPVQPRWVRVACTQGHSTLDSCRQVLDTTGKMNVDLVLLTEWMRGGLLPEPVPGPSSELMSEKSKQYNMYVAGNIVRHDEIKDRLYNTSLLYDRQGKLVGMYDKIHPYSPELNEADHGITPGSKVPIFQTDFGKVGFIICYDSWFTDVAQLLGLKGAEVILFSSAGYYRSLMPARAADNNVRIVASTSNNQYGVWDTIGRDVLTPDADPTAKPVHGQTFKDVVEIKVGDIGVLMVTLDLNCSPSPAYNGGTMFMAPGGKRNRRDQIYYLEGEIKQEMERWWIED